MKKYRSTILITALFSIYSISVNAHTPLFDCFNDGQSTIICEAGFSDGASAAGIEVRLANAQGRVLEQGKIGEDGSVKFNRPTEEFTVIFTAGEGHIITVFGDDIY